MEKAVSANKSPFATEPIGRLIVKFAVPSVTALLVNSLYNIVDQIFIGWGVGYLGNGATNIVFPITIVALALSMMISAAINSMIRADGSPSIPCFLWLWVRFSTSFWTQFLFLFSIWV